MLVFSGSSQSCPLTWNSEHKMELNRLNWELPFQANIAFLESLQPRNVIVSQDWSGAVVERL